MKENIFILLLACFFCISAKADGEDILESANALQNIVQTRKIPKQLIDKTKLIAVFSDVNQVGFLLGGLVGDGLLVQKQENSWSDPLHVNLKGGSLGLQFGYQKSDLVFFVLNQKVADEMTKRKITLGVDASVAFWDFGENYTDMTDISFTSDIYVFASNKGLFAGVSLGGVVFNVSDQTITTTSYARQRLQSVLQMLR